MITNYRDPSRGRGRTGGQRRKDGTPRHPLHIQGAGGGNRTLMRLPSRDFESRASTSFTTPAGMTIPFYGSLTGVSRRILPHG